MFLGQYLTSFTGKGRLVLPKGLRENFLGKEIVLSRGFENCIWGFSLEGFEELAKKQFEVSAALEDGRNLRRYLFSGSSKVFLDSQGRFVIPALLLEYANLEDESVIIGAGDHFEIWNVEFWNKHLKELEENFGRLS